MYRVRIKERWRKEVQTEGLKLKGLLRKLAKKKRGSRKKIWSLILQLKELGFQQSSKTVRRQALLNL